MGHSEIGYLQKLAVAFSHTVLAHSVSPPTPAMGHEEGIVPKAPGKKRVLWKVLEEAEAEVVFSRCSGTEF